MLAAERVHDVLARAEILDDDFLTPTALHTDLADIEIWRLVRCEENVVMGAIFMFLEHVRHDIATEMVIATGRKMASA